ncbi:response regulator [Thalassovita mediterranea]|jgi:CheY-like chemotaxis protein|uniref:Transcriptional regulatory protein YycF n=1 Tax=Thalassovita mediterranea TaxID=340021 RepID=A0A0P1H071_9RHOB|nr:response regulator [Thalassovita mediterranea]CUH83360.1 Transcriptional regulatory protein YycF [Thalassovita mediterranea]SIS34060.1 Response regulator receiver domain-containing protein [Thalassovita mediterranea]
MAHILLIEDDPAVRDTFEIILNADGHNVTTAVDGRQGLALLRSTDVDLVLTDIIMPNCDGVEVIRELRKHADAPPVIAISGGARTSAANYLEVAKLLGAQQILSKPIGAMELLRSVADVLAAQPVK